MDGLHPLPPQPYVGADAHECRKRAEDESRSAADRQVWATLAVAAELRIIRKLKRRGG